MNRYEWIEELSRFMQEHHDLVITADKHGYISASFFQAREGGFIGYVSGGRHITCGKQGDEFKQATYDFLNWVLEKESKR